MHSVSPVHVRVESNVKNPMTATNFEDLLNKSKKKVQIGPSTIVKHKSIVRIKNQQRTRCSNNQKSRSFSPKPFNNGSNLTSRNGHQIMAQTEYDHIPVREYSTTTKSKRNNQTETRTPPQIAVAGLSSCSTCIESRSRSRSESRSKSPLTSSKTNLANCCSLSSTNLPTLFKNDLFGLNKTSTNSRSRIATVAAAHSPIENSTRSFSIDDNNGDDSCCFNNKQINNKNNNNRNRLRSLSPIRCDDLNVNQSGHEPVNLTYTMKNRWSRSCDDSILKKENNFNSLVFTPTTNIATTNNNNKNNKSSRLSSSCESILSSDHTGCHLNRTRNLNQHSHSTVPNNKFDLITTRENLVCKLIETESSINEIACQLLYLKEFIENLFTCFSTTTSLNGCGTGSGSSNGTNKQLIINSTNLKRLELERANLLEKIDSFDLVNSDLKNIIYDLTSPICLEQIKNLQDNTSFAKQIDQLEMENNRYKKMLLELEKSMARTGSANEALNLEKTALVSLKSSLEDNRAHLRRQLISKESEVNRLNVQLKNLSRKLDRAELEIDFLKENRKRTGLGPIQLPQLKNATTTATTTTNSTNSLLVVNQNKNNQQKSNLNKNLKQIKHYFNLDEILIDPIKTRLYVDKLNTQIKEKEIVIKNLNESLANLKQKTSPAESDEMHSSDQQKSERWEKTQIERLRKENEKLKNSLHVKEEQLKTIEAKKKNLEKKLSINYTNNNSAHISQQQQLSSTANNSNKKQLPHHGSSSSEDAATTNLNSYSQQTSQQHQINRTNFSNANANNNNNNNRGQHSINESTNLNSRINKNDNYINSSSINVNHLNDDMSMAPPSRSDRGDIQRTQNFSEAELNSVRSRLQQRLNELEPLPELLKNTELKLHEALIKLRTYEIENFENKKLINELKSELDLSKANYQNLLTKLKETGTSSGSGAAAGGAGINTDRLPTMASMNENINLKQAEANARQTIIDNLTSAKLEPIERRLQILDEDNKELHRQLSVKEELIRELSSKLAIKTNEASSYKRQLDLAISDFNLKEQQLKENFNSRERTLNAKYNDLESKLTSMQYFSQNDKRDKEEMTQDYLMQIKDLKARLEQTQLTNKQMQDYVNFLKNSYITYFNDNTLHSFESSSNLIGGSQANLF